MTPLAAQEHFRPMDGAEAASQVREKFGIDRPYVLTVGDLQPRKNQVAALAAVERLDSLLLAVAGPERDQALAWTQRAYEDRRGWLAYLKVNPILDPVREEPGFQALRGRMRL